MPPLMQRPNPIVIAILSYGALALVARAPLAEAADQSCSSPTVPSLLPQTPPATKQKPKGEKDIATGGNIESDSQHYDYDVDRKVLILTGNVVVRQGDRE